MADQDEDSSTQDGNDETAEDTQEEVVNEDVVNEEDSEEEVEEEVVEEEEEEAQPSRRDERIQELADSNKMLRGLVETLTKRQTASQPEEDEPEFEDPEIGKAFNAKLNKARTGFQQQLGVIAEELDATKFDRVLLKDGIEEDSVPYRKITAELQNFREEKAQAGVYLRRAEAYEMLKARGTFKTKASVKKPVKKITVVKSKPHVGIQRSTDKSNKPDGSKKQFKTLTLKEKEKALENKAF